MRRVAWGGARSARTRCRPSRIGRSRSRRLVAGSSAFHAVAIFVIQRLGGCDIRRVCPGRVVLVAAPATATAASTTAARGRAVFVATWLFVGAFGGGGQC